MMMAEKYFYSLLLSLLALTSSKKITIDQGSKVAFQDEIPDPDLAYNMAILSKRVYSIDSLNSTNIPEDYEALYFEETLRGTEVVIVTPTDVKKNYLVVVFRGTEEGRDWLTDAQVNFTTYGPTDHPEDNAGLVHKGFNEASFFGKLHIRVLQKVWELLEDNPTLDIICTGHSLGGALSTFYGAYFAQSFTFKNILVINFGSPRVGSDHFKEWARNELPNLAIWRFVNRDDGVPRWPVGNRFFHAGHLIQFEDEGSTLYWQQLGNETLGYAGTPLSWDNQFTNFTDHATSLYIEYFENKVFANESIYYVDSFKEVPTVPAIPTVPTIPTAKHSNLRS